jgi:hypothetical protein
MLQLGDFKLLTECCIVSNGLNIFQYFLICLALKNRNDVIMVTSYITIRPKSSIAGASTGICVASDFAAYQSS